jgi:hypothetical protein
VTRFEEAFEQYKRQRLTGEEAGELLGMPLALRPRTDSRYFEVLRKEPKGPLSKRRAIV